MTDDSVDQLIAERAASYAKRTTQYALRGAVLDAAAAAGADPDDPLPEPLQAAYDPYSREIRRLDHEIAGLDQKLATERGQR
jgi:hypothetical protein